MDPGVGQVEAVRPARSHRAGRSPSDARSARPRRQCRWGSRRRRTRPRGRPAPRRPRRPSRHRARHRWWRPLRRPRRTRSARRPAAPNSAMPSSSRWLQQLEVAVVGLANDDQIDQPDRVAVTQPLDLGQDLAAGNRDGRSRRSASAPVPVIVCPPSRASSFCLAASNSSRAERAASSSPFSSAELADQIIAAGAAVPAGGRRGRGGGHRRRVLRLRLLRLQLLDARLLLASPLVLLLLPLASHVAGAADHRCSRQWPSSSNHRTASCSLELTASSRPQPYTARGPARIPSSYTERLR